jgi:ribosomal protein S12 methylthiotransferase
MTVNIITLGCSKNLVDSERLMLQFRASGHRVVHDDFTDPSDLVIINTCGFILDAKQESIDTILSFLEEKKRGRVKKLFVMGCLSERYRNELKTEMPEVDGFFGVWEMKEILEGAGSMLDRALLNDRMVTTPSHYAYLKVAEGCNRTCAFCAIPGIRGRQRSVPVEDLVEESRALAGKGTRELILIAQDLTGYGTDLYGNQALPRLLEELIRVDSIEWIRLHYAYPKGFPLEVIDLMAGEEKICNYLDIPIQHINDRILRTMGRGHGRKEMEDILYRFRQKIPDMALRTTILTGFPGEDETAFEELLQFLEEFRFDRLGVFPYSHEEDTPAARKFKDSIPGKAKQERADRIIELQQGISLSMNEARIGSTFRVLIDRREGEYYCGRTQYDSPEVDNEVLIPEDEAVQIGTFCNVRITAASEYELYGSPV